MSYQDTLFDLQGRVAIVTGGATGIGLSLATGLAAAGASVIIASRNTSRLEEAIREISAATGNRNVDFVHADLGNRDDTNRIVPEAVKRFGAVDILIGNAGHTLLEPIEKCTDICLDAQVEVNLVSNILLTRAAIPEMRRRGRGRIIYISSISASVATTDGMSVYGATKSALQGFSRAAAVELGGDGITVNCVAPGFTATAMVMDFIGSLGEAGVQFQKASAKTTALNRWARPDELVGTILLLASDAGSFITGQVLTVDGGTTVRMK